MTRSYKLFDTSWDGRCRPAKKPHIITEKTKSIYGTEVYLSDVLKGGRSKENSDGYTTFLIIDHLPQNKTYCVAAYYCKRLLQIINQISGCICVCEDSDNAEWLNEMIDDIYAEG